MLSLHYNHARKVRKVQYMMWTGIQTQRSSVWYMAVSLLLCVCVGVCVRVCVCVCVASPQKGVCFVVLDTSQSCLPKPPSSTASVIQCTTLGQGTGTWPSTTLTETISYSHVTLVYISTVYHLVTMHVEY